MTNSPMLRWALLSLCLTTSGTIAADTDYRFSYFANGRICVDTLAKIDGKGPIMAPPQSDWQDFKPSWSKTGDNLIFFRRIKNDTDVLNWKTILCIAKADGSGLQQLSDGTHTDFNPTWTRDGKNSPIWNRQVKKGQFMVMRSAIGNKPKQAVALTDPTRHHWAHSTVRDGRILVETDHPTQGYGYFLMTLKPGGKPIYERINDGGMLAKGLLIRVSVSPDETMVCYEHMLGYKFKEPGHAIYVSDFDVKTLTMRNHRCIANCEYGAGWYAYPRWTKDGKAVIYHADTTGKGRLFLHELKSGKTTQASTNNAIDFRYPHVEDTPK